MRATRSVLTRGFLLAMVSTLLAGGALAQGRRSSAPETDGWWSWAAAPADEAVRARAEDRAEEGATRSRRRGPADVGRRRGGPAPGKSGREGQGRRHRREDRVPEQRRGDRRYERRDESRGPAFCRTGAGHPVFGMAWCYEHGFGREGYEQRRGDWRYERRRHRSRRHPERRRSDWHWERRPDLEDILLGEPHYEQFSQRPDEGPFGNLLDRILSGHAERLLARLGGPVSVEGRWIEPWDGARVLQVRAGRQPIAELTDYDGDGRVDRALVANPNGRRH